MVERVEYAADHEKKRDYRNQSGIPRSAENQNGRSEPFPKRDAAIHVRKFSVGINNKITVTVFNARVCTAGYDQRQNVS